MLSRLAEGFIFTDTIWPGIRIVGGFSACTWKTRTAMGNDTGQPDRRCTSYWTREAQSFDYTAAKYASYSAAELLYS
jgi:hypothetical protein